MDSMRLEKSYRLIPREMSIEYSAVESALGRFIRLDKEGDFIGKDGLIAWEKRGAKNAFATIEVHGVTDADARGSEAIYKDGELVGRATSGGYGWRVGKSLALGMVQPELAIIGTKLEIEILGEMYQATVVEESPFDPTNFKLRA
jgi:dimethylglycine dehydrogenase